MVRIGSEDLGCDFSNGPDQESICGAAAEQCRATFQTDYRLELNAWTD
jgi:hypothetical protein